MYMDNTVATSFILFILLILIIALVFMNNNKPKNKMENVSPYVMMGALNNEKQNVVLVNVLSDKIPFLINSPDRANNMSLTKSLFEDLLKTTGLKDIDLVVIYCASWSCGAAQNYYDELEERGVDVSKIYDYKGALHEWAMYSLLVPNKVNMINLSTNNLATEEELMTLAKDTKHTYFLKDEINSSNKTISSLAKVGEAKTKEN